MKIIECIQGSPEWWKARAGIPTASEFSRIVTPVKWKPAEATEKYRNDKLAEIIGWRKTEFSGSPDIERGNRMEAEVRRWLAMEIGERINEVGFCLSDCGRYGTSPDGLTDAGIPVELKCPADNTYFGWKRDYKATGAMPAEHLPQVHGHMLVTGAPFCWFCFYPENERINPVAIRIERDEKTERLGEIVSAFCDLLAKERVELIDDIAFH